MAKVEMSSVMTGFLIVVSLAAAIYLLDPTFFGLFGRRREGFAAGGSKDSSKPETAPVAGATATGEMTAPGMNINGGAQAAAEMANPNVASKAGSGSEGFQDVTGYEGPAQFGSAEAPAGCYPRDQLTPSELLPKDQNSVWAQQNPMGTGSLKGKNFLSAGALIGVNTVGQSLRNANLQLRSEPPNPQVAVSVFNQSTIEPDINRRSLEIA
jgi:hypothetical protein